MSGDQKKTRLNRAKVLEAAVDLADEIGLEALTIRRLADELGVGAMTIYHHIASKEEIIDGMVENVFTEIELPPTDTDWKTAMRQRCISARQVLNRHPWAAPLLESRTVPGPASLKHHESVLACLRGGGLSLQTAAHAYAILDSFVYGFAFEEATLPASGGEGFAEVAEQMAAHFPADVYPHLAELTFDHVLQPGYNFGDSFEFGLNLILDGLDRAAEADQQKT
jgi:AcrR family transcriptional regulator